MLCTRAPTRATPLFLWAHPSTAPASGIGESASKWIAHARSGCHGPSASTADTGQSGHKRLPRPLDVFFFFVRSVTHYENLANLPRDRRRRSPSSAFPIKMIGGNGRDPPRLALLVAHTSRTEGTPCHGTQDHRDHDPDIAPTHGRLNGKFDHDGRRNRDAADVFARQRSERTGFPCRTARMTRRCRSQGSASLGNGEDGRRPSDRGSRSSSAYQNLGGRRSRAVGADGTSASASTREGAGRSPGFVTHVDCVRPQDFHDCIEWSRRGSPGARKSDCQALLIPR